MFRGIPGVPSLAGESFEADAVPEEMRVPLGDVLLIDSIGLFLSSTLFLLLVVA